MKSFYRRHFTFLSKLSILLFLYVFLLIIISKTQPSFSAFSSFLGSTGARLITSIDIFNVKFPCATILTSGSCEYDLYIESVELWSWIHVLWVVIAGMLSFITEWAWSR